MKKVRIKNFVTLVFSFSFILGLIFLLWFKSKTKQESILGEKTISSPSKRLPSFKVKPDNWEPYFPENYQKGNEELGENTEAVLSLNFETGEIFFAKNLHKKLPQASLVKIMTAAIALELGNLDKKIVIPAFATSNLPEDSAIMGISPGEKYFLEELLWGLLLPSGNDAAKAIAWTIAYKEPKFVELMNKKAAQLNLKDTSFGNASGLDDPKNFTSVFDLAVLTHFVYQNFPKFAEIASTKLAYLPFTEGEHKAIELGNLNEFLNFYPGAIGVKPGNTEKAGSCLAALVEQKGEKILVVLLNTDYRFYRAKKLFDFSFEKLGIKAIQ